MKQKITVLIILSSTLCGVLAQSNPSDIQPPYGPGVVDVRAPNAVWTYDFGDKSDGKGYNNGNLNSMRLELPISLRPQNSTHQKFMRWESGISGIHDNLSGTTEISGNVYLDDGEYAVMNYITFGMAGPTMTYNKGDHTTGTKKTGRYLVVNCSPTVRVNTEIRIDSILVSPCSDYRLTYWGANITEVAGGPFDAVPPVRLNIWGWANEVQNGGYLAQNVDHAFWLKSSLFANNLSWEKRTYEFNTRGHSVINIVLWMYAYSAGHDLALDDFKIERIGDCDCDHGDLPDSDVGSTGTDNYHTLTPYGAYHSVKPRGEAVFLGSETTDKEEDGQADATSTGDDNNDKDDEDALKPFFRTDRSSIVLDSIFVENNSGSNAFLYGWIDVNQDGELTDNERAKVNVSTGVRAYHALAFSGFSGQLVPGEYYVRLRVGTDEDQVKYAVGWAKDGEVEDHLVTIDDFGDFGDVPDSYGTTIAAGGAQHLRSQDNYNNSTGATGADGLPDLTLGTAFDGEIDGQPVSPHTDNNGTNGDGLDEDGIASLPKVCDKAHDYDVDVTVTNVTGAEAYLTAWLDYNHNGTFDSGEKISLTVPYNASSPTSTLNLKWENINFTSGTPGIPLDGHHYIRLRLSSDATSISSPGGLAPDGEVEDYRMEVVDDSPIPGTLTASASERCTGGDVTLSLSSSSGNITWEKSSDNFASDVSSISGETNTTLTVTNLTDTTWFRAVVSATYCEAAYSNVVKVNVAPQTVAGSITPESAQVCYDGGEILSLGGYTGEVVRWESSTNAAFSSPVIINNNTNQLSINHLTADTYYRAVVKSGECNEQTSAPVLISVIPQSEGGTISPDVTICEGSSTTISVTGYVGDILLWQSSSDGGATIDTIHSTAASITVNNINVTTMYRAVVRSGDCDDAYSTIITITVTEQSAGGILSPPTSNVIKDDNNTTLTLTGKRGDVLRWEYSTDDWATAQIISGHTADTYTAINLSETTKYRVWVKNGDCNEAVSAEAVIIVEEESNAGVLIPNAEVCTGTNATTLELQGYSGNIAKWEYSTDNWATYTTITPSPNPEDEYTVINLTSTTQYRVIVTGAGGQDTSNVATITVHPTSVGGELQPSNQRVCAGQGANIDLLGHVGDIIRWESSADNWTTVNAIANNTTHLSLYNLQETTAYRVVIKSGACDTVYSDTARIEVDPISVGGTLSKDTSVCTGVNEVTLRLSGETGSISHWESSKRPDFSPSTPIAHTSPQLTVNDLTQTTYYRVHVKSGACSSDHSNTVIVTVNPLSKGGTFEQNDFDVCTGTNATTLNVSAYVGNIVRWESSSSPSFSAVSVINNTNNQLTVTNLTDTTYYRMLVKSGACDSAYSDIAVINVSAESAGGTLQKDTTVCFASGVVTLRLEDYTGKTIYWKKSTDNWATFSPINKQDDSLVIYNLQQTTQYQAVVKSGACDEDLSSTVTITVMPETMGGTLSKDTTLCPETNSATLSLTGHVGNILQWEESPQPDFSSGVSIISNTTSTHTITNLTADTYYRVLVQSGEGCNTRYSNVVKVSIFDRAEGGKIQADTTVVCYDTQALLLLEGHKGSIVDWEFSGDGINFTALGDNANPLITPALQSETYFRAIVQSNDCQVVYSDTVKISIDEPSIGGTLSVENDDTVVCRGQNTVTIHLTGHRGAIYAWAKSTDNWKSYEIIPGETSATLTVSNLDADTTQFIAGVINGTCGIALSTTVMVVTKAQGNGGILSKDTTVCRGNHTLTLTLSEQTDSIMRWESSTDNFASDVTNLGGNENTTLTVSNLTQTTYYRVVSTNKICDDNHSDTVTVTVLDCDRGDAPDVYSTLSSSNGPVHYILPEAENIYIGSEKPDNEQDGQPENAANGDDTNGSDDEDGLSARFESDRSNIILNNIPIVNNTGLDAYLYAWIDVDHDGLFSAGERAKANIAIGFSGTVSLTFSGFNSLIQPDNYYVRLRVGAVEAEVEKPTGLSTSGEVEDHLICVYPDTIILDDATLVLCEDEGVINLDSCIHYLPQTGKTIQWVNSAGESVGKMYNTGSMTLDNIVLLYYHIEEEYCGVTKTSVGKLFLQKKDRIVLEDKQVRMCYVDATSVNLTTILGYQGAGTWSIVSPPSAAAYLNGNRFSGEAAYYAGTGDEQTFVFKFEPKVDACTSGSAEVTVIITDMF